MQFPTTAPVAVVLDIPAGRITLIAADRADATVEVLPANASQSRDVKAAEQIAVDYANGELRIVAATAKNRILGQGSGQVEVTVQVPTGSSFEGKAAAGELRGVGRLGDVTLEVAQGPVKLDETANARLTVLSGDVSLGRLGGSAEIKVQKGDIRITEAVSGSVELRTESGLIEVGAARGVSASLDAGTSYGRISNSLNNTEGADAALNIRATTSYGDITARSL